MPISYANILLRQAAGLVLVGASLAAGAQQGSGAPADQQVLADAQKQLHGKQYRGVHVAVNSGVLTLDGQVGTLSDKLEAEKRVERMHETASIQNNLKVDVSEVVSDQVLFNKLGKALTYDRQGYGTQPFNSITLQVRDGVATLGGEVVEPADKDSAVGIVTNTAGVRGLVDHLQVAPLSPLDARIRRAAYDAIYLAPQMTKYAIDPAKPVRIVVIDGHMTLTGVVQDRGDRDFIGVRANGIPGVFSVDNQVMVAGDTPERGGR